MKWICFLAGCIFSYTIEAQLSLSGKISDQSNALQGATVVIIGPVKATSMSDAAGVYYFNNLPAGNYSLSSSYAGYQQQKLNIQLPVNGNVDLQMTALNAVLLPVEIKGIRANERAPFTKSNLDKTFIEKNNLGQDIPNLLNQTPNVVINSDAGNGIGYTGIRIRGSDASRINMTINGIPYNDAESQGTFFVDLPDFISSVSSVQIQRGVGTSSNGAGAFGASMNFSTHEYNEKPYGELNNSFGSFNSFKNTLKFGSGLIGGKFTIDGRLSNISTDGYVDRASSSLQGGYLNAAYWGKKSSLKLNVILGKEKTYQSWYGISVTDLKNNRTFNPAGTEKPGEPYDNQTDNYWQNHYQLIYNKQFNNQVTLNTSFYLSTGRGYYEEYRAGSELGDYGLQPVIKGSDTTYSTDLIRRLWLKNKLFGQVFSIQKTKGKSQVTIGGGWSYYPGKHYGDLTWTAADPTLTNRWYDLDAKKSDANIYAKWQYTLTSNWSLFSDLQYRYAHYSIDGFRNNPDVRINEHWNFVNPKAGISYSKNNWSGFFSYAIGNKEPNRDDFEAGKLQLPKREQLHDFELNVLRKNILQGWNAGVTLYYMYYKDQLVLTGRINDVGSYTRTNIPKSYRAGIELETQYQWRKGNIRYNLALSNNKLKNFTEYIDDYDNGGQVAVKRGNPDIAFSPSIVQHAAAGYQFINNGEIEWLSKYVGKQYLDNSSDSFKSLDDFFTNDIRINYTIPFKKALKEIKLVLQVNNLFNVMYEPNGYTFSYIYNNITTTENFYFPMAGRNFMAAINIKF
ncbi:MAG: TonB-dependent receptor [Bacteroidota bacterium]